MRSQLLPLAGRFGMASKAVPLLRHSYLAQGLGESSGECGHGTNSYALSADAEIRLEGE
jgi:hypothetical protein